MCRHEHVEFGGWPNCIRLFNEEMELVVTTDVGPRIVRLGFIGRPNLFYLVPEQRGMAGGEEWRIYGGHRLWLAPEMMPRSYNPDNGKIEFEIRDNRLTLRQPREIISGVVKEMAITLQPDRNEVTVMHRIINRNAMAIELAPWSISVMAPGGRAIVPQEPYGEGDDYLLPARPLALWQFTRMNDPRWVWGEKYIQAKQDAAFNSEQKIGVLNKAGWTAYCVDGDVLIKKFSYLPGAVYPDFGCNSETYINGRFLEIETLGPVTSLPPGGSVDHMEYWRLEKRVVNESEASIDSYILPLVDSFVLPA